MIQRGARSLGSRFRTCSGRARSRLVIVRRMTPLQRRLAVARGDEPADLVVRGGRVLSVFTREWLEADVAIADGTIAGVGPYEGVETLDAAGRFVVPGFIDAHMHIESTKLLPDELARLILPLGTTAIVADPHEIANVLGTDGVHWLHDVSADLQRHIAWLQEYAALGFDSIYLHHVGQEQHEFIETFGERVLPELC